MPSLPELKSFIKKPISIKNLIKVDHLRGVYFSFSELKTVKSKSQI